VLGLRAISSKTVWSTDIWSTLHKETIDQMVGLSFHTFCVGKMSVGEMSVGQIVFDQMTRRDRVCIPSCYEGLILLKNKLFFNFTFFEKLNV
jgi:hypothetical protein